MIKMQKHKTQTTKIRNGAMIGAIALAIVALLIIGLNCVNPKDSSDTVPDKNQINTVGNTPSNLMNEGFATSQGNKIYYINRNSASADALMVMDWNGENKSQLYTFDGEMSHLNVIGNQLFFIGKVFTGDTFSATGAATLVEAAIYCFNLADGTVSTLYTSTNYIFSLFVIEDKMYFNAVENNKGSILSANLNGSDLTCIMKTADPIDCFSITGQYMYYSVGEFQTSFYRCDMDGSNKTAFANMPGSPCYCIVNSKIYFVESVYDPISSFVDTVECPVIYRMDLDGDHKKEILRSKGNHGIGYLNIVDDVLYYADSTETYVDPATENYHYEIYAKKGNGAPEKIAEIDNLIDGLSVCGDWLFYFDADKQETVIIEL